uniref:Uncharacterized protein LOC107431039 n=1 Tax=Rhizophora mucronata TaxID=61149 RepID=A0A2P2IRI6_RHIMU
MNPSYSHQQTWAAWKTYNISGPMSTSLKSTSGFARNLKKSELGGVIFGCNSNTIKECLNKQLFGLPVQHFSYVKNIDPGLPLFLFNYTDRKLHGIFEAASSGQMTIDPYGWTTDGSERTQYPAQVQICVRLQCQPLLEENFKPRIADNYFSHNHFWFELDHTQTSKLMHLFASVAVAPTTSVPQEAVKWRPMCRALSSTETREESDGFRLSLGLENFDESCISLLNENLLVKDQLDRNAVDQNERDIIFQKLQELAHSYGPKDLPLKNNIEDSADVNDMNLEENGLPSDPIGSEERAEESACTSLSCQSTIALLVQEIEELKAFKREQTLKTDHLENMLVDVEEEIQQLKIMFKSKPNPSTLDTDETDIDSFDSLNLDPTESVYLVGGYDGDSCLSALDLYFPSQDVVKSLRPMTSIRSYASVAALNEELYVFGGGNGHLWYNSVESYSPASDQWMLRPSLTKEKGGLSGATLDNKIFAIGGGNGMDCFSDVEMLDLDIGRWILTRSMMQKRFSLAAVELNGVLYATGGFDGNDYLKSAERFDPREHSWTKIPNMDTKRACHSLVVLNEKM